MCDDLLVWRRAAYHAGRFGQVEVTRTTCVLVTTAALAIGPIAAKAAGTGLLAMSAARGKQTFTGTITDNLCANARHSEMRMGTTDAECTIACIAAHGATYVLSDDKGAYYTLSDQQKAEKFAAQKVRVLGTLDVKTRTIQVKSMTAAK